MVGIRPFLLAFLMLALFAPASASGEPTTRIIVKREPGLTAAEQRDIRADVGASLVERLSVPRMEVIEVPRSEAVAALRRLRRDGDVAGAQVDSVVRAFDADPDMGLLWGFHNAGEPDQVAWRWDDATEQWVDLPVRDEADMHIVEAWSAIDPDWETDPDPLVAGRGHTVAILDGGVNRSHGDLGAERVAAGYDWVDEDTDADDERGHGTHVAGTIAATRANGVGVAGVAPEARVLPLRVLDAEGEGNVSDVIEAIHFAGVQEIRVVNVSFGVVGGNPALLRQEIQDHAKTLIVAAAGNSGADTDDPSEATYPCSLTRDVDNVICIGASDATDARPTWSNYGADTVDVYAPGEGIRSAWVPDPEYPHDYAYQSGTSMAAPHIAGLAALMVARDPSLSSAQIKAKINATADRRDGMTSVSGGRANAFEALNLVPADRDGDGFIDDVDNCPDVTNPAQDDACGAVAAPDSDGDGVLDADDNCDYEKGSVTNAGCPGDAADSNGDGIPDIFDADNDGKTDKRDNCPTDPNQADPDRDGVGGRCDTTPRGPDIDRDGKPALDDRCPTAYARTANGCPIPPPPDRDRDGRLDVSDACPFEPAASLNGCPLPAVTALSAKSRKRRATISVRTSRAATVKITIKRKRGHRWVRVTSTLLATTANRATLRKRLRRGQYRAIVVLSSSAGRTHAQTLRFPVR